MAGLSCCTLLSVLCLNIFHFGRSAARSAKRSYESTILSIMRLSFRVVHLLRKSAALFRASAPMFGIINYPGHRNSPIGTARQGPSQPHLATHDAPTSCSSFLILIAASRVTVLAGISRIKLSEQARCSAAASSWQLSLGTSRSTRDFINLVTRLRKSPPHFR
jgi:hypothetical protein